MWSGPLTSHMLLHHAALAMLILSTCPCSCQRLASFLMSLSGPFGPTSTAPLWTTCNGCNNRPHDVHVGLKLGWLVCHSTFVWTWRDLENSIATYGLQCNSPVQSEWHAENVTACSCVICGFQSWLQCCRTSVCTRLQVYYCCRAQSSRWSPGFASMTWPSSQQGNHKQFCQRLL